MSTEILSDKNVQGAKAKIVGASREYKDLNLKFKLHPALGDVRPVKDLEAIKNSLRNILATRRGEKPFRPDFGCNLKAYLFEPADGITKAAIRQDITRSIEDNEPRVSIKEIAIEDYSDRNAYFITITAMIKNNQQEIELELLLERLR